MKDMMKELTEYLEKNNEYLNLFKYERKNNEEEKKEKEDE